MRPTLKSRIILGKMSQVLLKDCAFVVTQDSDRRILRNKSVLIENDKIVKISGHITPSKRTKIIDAQDLVLMPGLINMHSHVPMNVLRGVGSGLNLQDWLHEIFKREAKLTSKDIFEGSFDAFKELVGSGVTTTADMYFHLKDIADAAREVGIRVFLGYGMIDLFNSKKQVLEEKQTERDFKYITSLNDELIQFIVSPHAPNTCSKQLLEWSKDFSFNHKLLLSTHAAETMKEVEFIKKKYHKEITRYLNNLGYLDNTILFHGIHLDYKYIAKLKHKPTIVHCPSSNLKLESGILDLKDVLLSGSNLCLGTDGSASNNNLDLLEELKIAALLYKANRILKHDELFIEQRLLDTITVNPARALNINAGSISVGKLADLTLLRLDNHLSFSNKKTLVDNIIYSANSSDVVITIVNGKIVYDSS